MTKWRALAQKMHEQLSASSAIFDESASPGQVKPARDGQSPERVDMDTGCTRGMSGSEGGSVGIDNKDQAKFNEDLLCEHGKDFKALKTFRSSLRVDNYTACLDN